MTEEGVFYTACHNIVPKKRKVMKEDPGRHIDLFDKLIEL